MAAVETPSSQVVSPTLSNRSAPSSSRAFSPPPFIKVPTDPSHAADETLSGPSRHFISPAQFSAWQALNPIDRARLRPKPFGQGTAVKGMTPYEAPKHPAASLLHNIPDRRTSSRCNIVDWILWLATKELREGGRTAVEAKRTAEDAARRKRISEGKRKSGIEGQDEDEDEEMDDVKPFETVEDVAALSTAYELLTKSLTRSQGLSKIAISMLEGAQPCPVSVSEQLGKGVKVGSSVSVRAASGWGGQGQQRWSGLVERRRRYAWVVRGLVYLPVPEVVVAPATSPIASPQVRFQTFALPSGAPLTSSTHHGAVKSAGPTQIKELDVIAHLAPAASTTSTAGTSQRTTRSAATGMLSDGRSSRSLVARKMAAEAASAGATTSTDVPLTAASHLTPHEDYRILYSNRRKRRAEGIYQHGVLGAEEGASAEVPDDADWCRPHRVRGCETCRRLTTFKTPSSPEKGGASTKKAPRPVNVGDGLLDVPKLDPRTSALASTIPDFLLLSADVLRRYDRGAFGLPEDEDVVAELAANGGWEKAILGMEDKTAGPASVSASSEGAERGSKSPKEPSKEGIKHRPGKKWYDVFSGLVVQTVLEGYMLHGWKGLAPIEVLCSLGCGGYEASRFPPSVVATGTKTSEAKEGDVTGWDEEVKEQEAKARKVWEAAMVLFGTNCPDKGEYERSLRDVSSEFFDVPEGTSLANHLDKLSAKYPRSEFDEKMLDWLDVVDLSMGKPELAKYEERAAAGNAPYGSPRTPTSGLSSPAFGTIRNDFTGLDRFFTLIELDETPVPAAVAVGVAPVVPGALPKEGEKRKRTSEGPPSNTAGSRSPEAKRRTLG